jgi:insertion element IS1 protein InsB
MIPREACPQCGSMWFKRNGYTHTGKQNHRCKVCGRAFVLHPTHSVITEEQRLPIERLLLERISLCGICRARGVGLRWLLQFMGARFAVAPEHPYIMPPAGTRAGILQRLEAKKDDLWSFVGTKANRKWTGIAMDANPRQVIAFHEGDRSRRSAKQLWRNLPAGCREQAAFYTDLYEVYRGVIPPTQHHTSSKQAQNTNHVERCNCTLRQQVSRLVRATLSFSKKLTNHIGTIRYFICNHNLTSSAALPG